MKKTIVLAAVLLSSAAVSSVFAQGQVLWGNQFTGSLAARVYTPETQNSQLQLRGNVAGPAGIPAGTTVYTGTPVSGTGFTMGLFLGASDAEAVASATANATAAFRTGNAAGFISGVNFTDPTRTPGTAVSAQFRAWNNLGGTVTSWAQVMARSMAGDPQIQAGSSDPFNVGPLGGTLNGVFTPIPTTLGVRSFNLTTPVPEPSLIALGALGLGALLLRRRRK